DLAGLGGFDDGGHSFGHGVVGHANLDLNFREEVHGVFAAAVDLGMTLLSTEAFDFGHGHALDPDFGQRRLHFLELERLDDRNDEFHVGSSLRLAGVALFTVFVDVETLAFDLFGRPQADGDLHEVGNNHRGDDRHQ